jgi:adenylate cyclase
MRSSAERIVLAPLGAAASGELASGLLGRDASLGDLAERIVERTGGNPFFIEEIVQALADAETLVGERGAYRLVEPVTSLALPASVQVVLAARIDRLPEQDKQILQTAAVIGKGFTRDVLARVSGSDDLELARALDRLTAIGLVYPDSATVAGDASYAFKHPLTQEVAYRTQLATRREQIHAAVAEVLEELYAARLDEVAALLAHHRENARDYLAAARWSRRAAERAMRGDVIAAVRLWEKARTLAAGLPPSDETVEIGVWAGIQLLNLGWRVGLTADEARTLFEEGLELARHAKDSSAASGFYVTYGAVKGMAGEPERALELVTEAARLAREAGDLGTEIATEAALVQSQIMTGRLRDALVTVDRALATSAAHPGLGSQQTGFDPHTWLLMMRGGIRIETGDLHGAERDLGQALGEARRLGEVEIVGWCHEMIGYHARWLGDLDGSLAHARQAVEIAERMGSAFSQASAYGTLGLAHRYRGEWSEARSALEHALEVIRERRTFLHWEAASLSQLAEVDAAEGRGELAPRAGRRSRRARAPSRYAVHRAPGVAVAGAGAARKRRLVGAGRGVARSRARREARRHHGRRELAPARARRARGVRAPFWDQVDVRERARAGAPLLRGDRRVGSGVRSRLGFARERVTAARESSSGATRATLPSFRRVAWIALIARSAPSSSWRARRRRVRSGSGRRPCRRRSRRRR